jgi:xanthine/uracil permease
MIRVIPETAGWLCAWFAAIITTIPDCVFGGMTTFL